MALNGERHVLVVAGSDSSGGAGIARDIATIAAYGVRSCLAVTAVTVQTHDAVRQVMPVEAGLVEAQMRSALEANAVVSIKIGMLGTATIARSVAAVLADHRQVPVVFDPVLAASSGRSLHDPGPLAGLHDLIWPRCTLLTPNLPELARLTGSTAQAPCEDAAIQQARMLLDQGVQAVLVKGGHATGEDAVDILVTPAGPPRRYAASRLPVSMRGTGCALSSAIAAGLATGLDLSAAVDGAKRYLHAKLAALVAMS